jgi:hypothetical protein
VRRRQIVGRCARGIDIGALDHGAGVELDAAAGELRSVEGAKGRGSCVDELGAVGSRTRPSASKAATTALGIAGPERLGVPADHGGDTQLRARTEQRRPLGRVAGQQSGAEVDADLFDPTLGVMVGDHRMREFDPPVPGPEMDDQLLETALRENGALHVFDRGVVIPQQPTLGVGEELTELALAFDVPARESGAPILRAGAWDSKVLRGGSRDA